jgi:hypothetical protein
MQLVFFYQNSLYLKVRKLKMITLKIVGQEHAWQCKTFFLFKEFLSFFISLVLEGIFQSNMNILILNWHGSHVTQKAIEQAQTLGLDMVILPSHTSHALQPLNVNYFKFFLIAFKKGKDKNMVRSNY